MRYVFNLVVLLFLMVSCSNQTPSAEQNSTVAATTSQSVQTQSSTSTATKLVSATATADIIQPTPTPILYNVVLNDTLIGVALKFNITLESLILANPSIENQPLIVGQELLIPQPEDTRATSTITPIPIRISQVNCLLNKDDSLLCLVLVNNDQAEWIQNLSIQISLIDQTGKVLDSIIAYPPLDLLAPGKDTVVSGLFLTIPSGEFQPQANLISASTLSSPSDQYPKVSLHNVLTEVNWEGSSAQVSGGVYLDIDASETKRIWILAIAFDKEDSVVGYRRWESYDSLKPGEILPFEFMVSSQNSVIDHVELTVEATR